MYCVNCGVKLADTENICPLCGIKAYHPDFEQNQEEGMYPRGKYPAAEANALGLPILLTAIFALPLLVALACDLRFNQTITWSGYVIGALVFLYVSLILPTWFKNPNPVIFVPCTFAAAGVYLLYINCATGGEWFLSFAFPITGCVGMIVTAVTVLLRYVKKGKLYIIGGALIALGAVMLLLEFLLHITFGMMHSVGWSFYPLSGLVLTGGFLIFLGICRPARELMERNFFV